MIHPMFILSAVAAWGLAEQSDGAADRPFYLPENAHYTIVDSALDSLRFTLTKTLRENAQGHLESVSSFVNPEGQAMAWHDFGNLEGPGWAANAVGGAYEIFLFGKLLDKRDWQQQALKVLDHVLEDGFIDPKSGFIRPYRLTTSGEFCLNYTHNSDWFCPGFDGEGGLSATVVLRLAAGRREVRHNARCGAPLRSMDRHPRCVRPERLVSPPNDAGR